MEMLDFSSLSLNDMNVPDMPELPAILLNNIDTGYNSIMNSDTISELFINIYLNESPSITFEDMQQKLIEFYFQEANDNLLSNHIDNIFNMIHESVWWEVVMVRNKTYYTTFNDDDNIQLLINFIFSSYGTEYLQDIYNMNCVVVDA
jgi:hypothetical protein